MTNLGTLLTDNFSRIHIVNLRDRADRQRETVAELKKVMISPDEERVVFLAATRPINAGSFSSIGARGCFESHLAIIENAITDDIETLLVLEDDIRLLAQSSAHCQSLSDRLAKRDWSIFYGGFEGASATALTSDAGMAIVPPERHLLTSHCVGFRRDALLLLAPYLRQMMARPGGSSEGGPMHVDGAYSWFRRAHPNLVTIATIPPIAAQRSSRSDVADTGFRDRNPIARYATAQLRKLKRAFD